MIRFPSALAQVEKQLNARDYMQPVANTPVHQEQSAPPKESRRGKYKDLDKRREYQRNLMAQRRAKKKAQANTGE